MSTWVSARDAGAGNILLPVIRRLEARPGVRLQVVAEGPALQILRKGGAAVEEVPADSGQRERFLQKRWEEAVPDALLLGTSWGPSIEKELLRIGQERGVPTLSVVDHWCNYRERFTESNGGVRFPNRISLMDEIALEQAVAEGLPREILKIGGQPHLQSLAARAQDPELLAQARQLRGTWMDGAPAELILFASEPFSDDFRPGTSHDRGYTEIDVLEGLAQALQFVEKQGGRPLKLVVKLHPKEDRDRFRPGPLACARGFLLAQAEPPLACLLAADAVVGMTTMLLVEAALLGRPAVSFQPARGLATSFIGTEAGLVRSGRSPEAIANHLSDCLSSSAAVSASGSDFVRRLLSGDAAGRIADLLCDLRAEVVG